MTVSDSLGRHAGGFMTSVELTWIAKRVEHRIRFGRPESSQRIDRNRRVAAFAPGAIFAFVRWGANDYGTVISRVDIVRTVAAGEPYQTLPFVRPGGDILLRINTWPQVERVLHAIDAVEALGIDAADASPGYWRHLHNRLTAAAAPRPYTLAQHRAYQLRSRLAP